MTTTKVKGITLTLGNEVFVVPPLNFRSLQALQARLVNFSGGTDPESIQLVADAALESLKRNYPDMTADRVIDLLDLENMQAVMEAVMDVSGLKRKALEAQEGAAGEASHPSSGTTSTPT
jgi:hypothetical protein